MIKEQELNLFSCELKHLYLKEIHLPIKAKDLMDKVFEDARIDISNKQLIYLKMRQYHKKEFKPRDLNRYRYLWDWFDTGDTIYDCSNIVKSDNIFKSNHIYKSNYVNRCARCDYLLFCNNICDQNYRAFNKPVTPTRFKELYAMSLTELKKQPEFDAKLYKLLRTIRNKIRKGESHNEY
jgi:radical SAM protein with 4Fe4S-binding SPASM domain